MTHRPPPTAECPLCTVGRIVRWARGILAPPTASSRRGVGTLRHASVSACHRSVGQRHGSRWTYASTNPGKDRQPAQINHLPARPSRRPWTDPDCARHHHRATRRARVPAHTRRDDLSMTQVPNVYRSHSLFSAVLALRTTDASESASLRSLQGPGGRWVFGVGVAPSQRASIPRSRQH